MGLAPTLILSPESEGSVSSPCVPWLAPDPAVERGSGESPPESPQGSPPQCEGELHQESEEIGGGGGEAKETIASEQADPEATQAYALEDDSETGFVLILCIRENMGIY